MKEDDGGRLEVTRTVLPDLEEYTGFLEGIWERNWITNHGPLCARLERELADYLGVKHVLLVANGTLALQIGIRALRCGGDVVTTPFSYVASTAGIVWEGCRPVFADVETDTLCIDPEKVEEAITPATSAILAVHVYGNLCDVERLRDLSKRRGIPVLYDAAHAFGTRYRGGSMAAWGDLVALSFHATKLFHTAEGGALATNDDGLADRVRLLRNFGHTAPEAFGEVGTNAKMSELHAALGLCLLPRVPVLIAARRLVAEAYDAAFRGVDGARRPALREGVEYNFAFYPVVFPTEECREKVTAALQAANVFPRRYFAPPLSDLPYVDSPPMPVADAAARRVLCLPLHSGMSPERAAAVAGVVAGALAGE